MFDEVQSLVTSCVDGFNVCIFAYGQTGSGKTFTMEVRNKWHHLAIDYFQTLSNNVVILLVQDAINTIPVTFYSFCINLVS